MQPTERRAQLLHIHDNLTVDQDSDIRSVHIPPPETESPAIGSDVIRRRSVFHRSLRNTTCVIEIEEDGPNRTSLASGYHRSLSDDTVRADRALQTMNNPCSAIPSVASSDTYMWKTRSVIWFEKKDIREDALSGDVTAQLCDLFGAEEAGGYVRLQRGTTEAHVHRCTCEYTHCPVVWISRVGGWVEVGVGRGRERGRGER